MGRITSRITPGEGVCPEYLAGNPDHALPYDPDCPLCLPHPLSRPKPRVMGGLRDLVSCLRCMGTGTEIMIGGPSRPCSCRALRFK